MIVGGLVLALLGWWLVRMAWSLACGAIGGLVGALVGLSVFAGKGEAVYAALIAAGGFLLFAIVGFLAFRLAVIVASCLQGASGVAWGVLKLVLLVPSVGQPVMVALQRLPWLLGVLVLVPAIVGIIVQWGDTRSMPKEPGKAKKAKPKGKQGEE
jgi:hypothetical protein